MRSLFSLLLFSALLGLAACDSSNEPSDAEVFVGSWRLAALADDGGDRSDVRSGFVRAGLDFDDEGRYVATFLETGEVGVGVSGAYEVRESTKDLLLSYPQGGLERQLVFDYVIRSENEIVLESTAADAALLLGTSATLAGTVSMVLTR